MPITNVIALSVLPLLFAAACFYLLIRLRSPRPRRKPASPFGFYPVAAGNALQTVQAILQPSARHALALRFEDEADEDDTGDPNDPMQHLHRQAAGIRRGDPVDRMTAMLPSHPATSAPPG